MEYAGVAEAGGVKLVARSLCEELVREGHRVTVIMPLFGCTDKSGFADEKDIQTADFVINGEVEKVTFTAASLPFTPSQSVRFIFVRSLHFAQKLAVYTYTAEEEAKCAEHKKGMGHKDARLLDTLLCKAAACIIEYMAHSSEKADIVLAQDAACACVSVYLAEGGAVQALGAWPAEGSSAGRLNRRVLHSRAKSAGAAQADGGTLPQERVSAVADSENIPVAFPPPCVVTIHNAAPAYHHRFATLQEAQSYTGLSRQVLCGAFNGRAVEPFLLAAECAALTTVSEEYALELLDRKSELATDGLSQAFRDRGVEIKGILNGIDFDRYDPAGGESLLPYRFDATAGDFEGKMLCRKKLFSTLDDAPCPVYPSGTKAFISYVSSAAFKQAAVFCFHGRMVHQKGIRVLCDAVRIVLGESNGEEASGVEGEYEGTRDGALEEAHQGVRLPRALFVIMGQGESETEEMARAVAEDYPSNVIYIKGYDKALSRLVIAASDFIVLPSISEPCGQEDFIAQIYGTLPVAHATGGLKKIIDGKTGFLYQPNTPDVLSGALRRMIKMKAHEGKRLLSMAQEAAKNVKEMHSWKTVVQKGYLPLFHEIMHLPPSTNSTVVASGQ